MKPVIAIAKLELQKLPHAELKLALLAEKVSEMNHQSIYVSQTETQLIEFICYLKDSAIRFEYFSNEEELKAMLTKPAA